MEVSVSALRAELKSWISRARAGEDVVITERGVPVARLSAVATADLLAELAREGLLTPAAEPRAEVAPQAAQAESAAPVVHAAPTVRTAPAVRTERRAARGVADIVRRIRG